MKYIGSKTRLAKHIAPIINDIIKRYDIDTYIEPFCGGLNMMEHINCKNRIAYDINRYLINMWKDILNGWMPPKELTKEDYNNIKNNKDNYSDSMVAIAGLCATYNAKWFGGYAGIVHTKANTIRNYYDESIRNILKQKDKLIGVKLICDTYENIECKNSLLYCDPPYEGTTKYKNIDNFDYDTYWNKIRDWSKDNIVLCSEYHAPFDFVCIYEKTLTTTLDKNSRKKDTEKLFIHEKSYEKIKNSIIIKNQ